MTFPIIHTVDALLRTLLAPVCASCRAPLDRPLAGPVCEACWRAVSRLTPPICARCGDALPSWRTADEACVRCRRRAPAFALARSAGRYDGALRAIVHAFKYAGCRALAGPLGRLMADAAGDVLADVDAVVPVPLHPRRHWRRGFNQADDLARALGLPVWRVLRRRRHGPPQAGLPAARRHANVRSAYALSLATHLRPWRRAAIRGAILVLIDDVMTTGATLDACARVLRAAGAREVRALTLARAVAARPPRPLAPLRLAIARRR